jgi:hypothetical protein
MVSVSRFVMVSLSRFVMVSLSRFVMVSLSNHDKYARTVLRLRSLRSLRSG